jgi:SWI/SNF-related matrix-associated actin-dependent regulator 1 of chromatin subfamily A
MTPALYSFQAKAIQALVVATKPIINAADPGLGKSRVALAVLEARKFRRVLIACPHSVLLVWQAEIAKWWPKSPPVMIVRQGFLIPDGEVIALISYGLLSETSGRVAERLEQTDPFQAAILDEAHFLKNAKSNRAKRVFKLLPRLGWVHPMTGTPAPNNVSELWPITFHLRPDLILSPVNGKPMHESEFKSRYCLI